MSQPNQPLGSETVTAGDGTGSTTVEHQYAYVGDVRLHYVTAGDESDPPVVLFHGWPQTWYEWRRVLPALAENHRVVAPDLRGLGDSTRPMEGYDKATVAGDVHALVEELGHDEIALVGHDWGMPTAYLYAAAHRDEVAALVTLDATLPGVDVGEDGESDLTLPNGAPIWHFGLHMTPNLPETLVEGNEREYLSWFYTQLAYDPGAITEDDVDEYVRCYSKPGALRAGFTYYRESTTDAVDVAEHAEEPLEMPVMAYGGRLGFAEATRATMEQVATDVRGGVVEQCGHWIPEERPAFLREELTTFLADVGWSG
jgi:pimeloyl-ACP methyl ester carboxylesterase